MIIFTNLQPTQLEREYVKLLTNYTNECLKIFKRYSKEYFTSAELNQFKRLDEATNDVENFKKKSLAAISGLTVILTKEIKKIAKGVNKFNYNTVLNGVKRVKNLKLQAPTLLDIRKHQLIKIFVKQNVNLITTLNTKILDKIENEVYNAIITGTSYKDLSTQLQSIMDVAKYRAEFIARDQISKLNGQLGRERCLDMKINEYTWLTSKDERVRKSHEVLEGLVCQWLNVETFRRDQTDRLKKRKSILAVEQHPGQDYQCRCTFIAIA